MSSKVTLTWFKGQNHTKSVHRVHSPIEKVILIICTNATPIINFLISCAAETSYGYNVEKIIPIDPPEAMLWANFEVNLNLSTQGLLLPSNNHHRHVRETILYMIGYFDAIGDIITLR